MRGFGIVGGGAVLFSTSALAGTSILPIVGETFSYVCGPWNFEMVMSEFHKLCSTNALGAAVTTIGGGAVATRAMCSAPFCR